MSVCESDLLIFSVLFLHAFFSQSTLFCAIDPESFLTGLRLVCFEKSVKSFIFIHFISVKT